MGLTLAREGSGPSFESTAGSCLVAGVSSLGFGDGWNGSRRDAIATGLDSFGSGLGTLGSGFSTLGSGFSTLGSVFNTLGSGLRVGSICLDWLRDCVGGVVTSEMPSNSNCKSNPIKSNSFRIAFKSSSKQQQVNNK